MCSVRLMFHQCVIMKTLGLCLMSWLQKHMSFTVDLHDPIIMAELNRIISQKRLEQLECVAEVR